MKCRSLFLKLLCLSICLQVVAQAEPKDPDPLRRAILKLQEDIRRDTEGLNDLRARVDAERRPLEERRERLRRAVEEKRDELEGMRERRLQGEQQQRELLAGTEAMAEEADFLRSLFLEYARSMDTRMNAARDPSVVAGLNAAREGLDDQAIPLATGVGALLEVSDTWNRGRIGGTVFPGRAADRDGMEHDGHFSCFGPAAYFAAQDDGPAGLATLRFGSDCPAIHDALDPTALEAIRALVAGNLAAVPVDASGGDALRVAEASPGLIEHLAQGGFTMIPLAVVALSALLLAIWKLIDLSRMQVRAEDGVASVLRALRAGDVDAAREQADTIQKPLRLLVDDLITHHDAPREHLEEIMYEHVLASLPYVERNLGALAVLGGVAPLLGLLGTVTGMIHTFQLVTLFGSGDAKLLSGGISEALVTTETGLAIAIPTLLVHAWLSRRARGMITAMETMATSIVNDLKLRKPA